MKPGGRRGAVLPTIAPGRAEAARALERAALTGGADIVDRPELAAFDGLDTALEYLHGRWVTHLGVAVDATLEASLAEPVTAIHLGWERVRSSHAGLAAILARHSTHPAVAVADQRHRAVLAAAIGCRPDQLPSFTGPGSVPAKSVASGARAALVATPRG